MLPRVAAVDREDGLRLHENVTPLPLPIKAAWPEAAPALRFAAVTALRTAAHPGTEAPRRLRRLWAPLAMATAVAFAPACDRPPSADSLREWTPADHHSSDDDKLAQGTLQPAARA